MKAPLLTAAFVMGSAPCLGAELSIQPRIGITILGTDAPTGGMSAGLTVRGVFKLQETPGLGVYAGAGSEVIGLTGGWYHMGVIAGPRAGVWLQHKSLFVSSGVGLLYGQLSTCRAWEMGARQCMRWWNPWPEIAAHAGYRTKDMHIGADVSALILSVPWGADVGLGLAASGSWR